MELSVRQYGQLTEVQKAETVEIFIDSFGHLMNFTNDRNKLKSLFYHALDSFYTYVLIENGTVAGMIGLATNKVRPINFKIDICKKIFGKLKGTLLSKQLNAIFQSKVVKGDSDLYIDVLATARQYLGKGIATRLLEFSFDLPDYDNYYVQVLSKNINAKRLYEKIGFVEYKKSRFSLMALKGFGYPINMKK